MAHDESRAVGPAGPRLAPATTARPRAAALLLGSLWLAVVAAGVAWLSRYAGAPGAPAAAPAEWPAASAVSPEPGRPTLVMFVHPQCACSRASLEILARLLAEVDEGPHRVQPVVLVSAPAAMDAAWTHSDLWQQATAIPGVRVVADRGGREATRFGAATSGQTMLYDADGRLRFSGGITPARGHAGDSSGRTALRALLHDAPAPSDGAAVFGCGLHDPAGAAAEARL